MKSWVPVAAVTASLLAATFAFPGQAPAVVASPEPTDPDPDSAELSITGSVTYRELKFEEAGTPKVEFTGRVMAPELRQDAKLHTVWHADRGTLPRPVQTGVLYRKNTVRLTITTRFEDLARLFAEDAAPAPTPIPSPTPTPVDRR